MRSILFPNDLDGFFSHPFFYGPFAVLFLSSMASDPPLPPWKATAEEVQEYQDRCNVFMHWFYRISGFLALSDMALHWVVLSVLIRADSIIYFWVSLTCLIFAGIIYTMLLNSVYSNRSPTAYELLSRFFFGLLISPLIPFIIYLWELQNPRIMAFFQFLDFMPVFEFLRPTLKGDRFSSLLGN